MGSRLQLIGHPLALRTFCRLSTMACSVKSRVRKADDRLRHHCTYIPRARQSVPELWSHGFEQEFLDPLPKGSSGIAESVFHWKNMGFPATDHTPLVAGRGPRSLSSGNATPDGRECGEDAALREV